MLQKKITHVQKMEFLVRMFSFYSDRQTRLETSGRVFRDRKRPAECKLSRWIWQSRKEETHYFVLVVHERVVFLLPYWMCSWVILKILLLKISSVVFEAEPRSEKGSKNIFELIIRVPVLLMMPRSILWSPIFLGPISIISTSFFRIN